MVGVNWNRRRKSEFNPLQTVTPAQFISEGGVCGGGLHKVEPKDWRRFLPALCLRASMDTCVSSGRKNDSHERNCRVEPVTEL
jgi:hypothetical protein